MSQNWKTATIQLKRNIGIDEIDISSEEGDTKVSYRTDCVQAFDEYLNEQEWDSLQKDIARQAFSCAFDYGSLNGATEEIKEHAVNQLKPAKNKKAREIIDKLRMNRQ